MATTEQILSGKNLTGLIQGVKSGLPLKIPPAFLTPTRSVKGNVATYRKVEGAREVAKIVAYGNAAQVRAQKGVTEVPVNLLHTFESINISPSKLINLLTSDGGADQKLGADEVTRQVTEFKQAFVNLRIAATMQALLQFHIYANVDGNLLPSSSNAVVNVDYGVAASQINNGAAGIDPLVTSTNIILASWATAGTPIITQLRNLKQAAMQFSGYPLAYAFYGNSIPGYIAANTEASKYLAGNQELSRQYLESGEVPAGFMGMTWIPIGDAFYVDQNGAVQTLLAVDNVVFTPAPSLDWWEFIEGTYPVPSNFGPTAVDASALIQGMSEVAGMFSFAGGTLNPPSVQMFAGDTFLPVLKVPKAVFRVDTAW